MVRRGNGLSTKSSAHVEITLCDKCDQPYCFYFRGIFENISAFPHSLRAYEKRLQYHKKTIVGRRCPRKNVLLIFVLLPFAYRSFTFTGRSTTASTF